MNTQNITFRLLAYTDAAGKYDAQAYRCGNEDNFYVDDNLADNLISHCNPDQPTTLSDVGMLMVVADGMGGMNAGEVASQIAIDTVKSFFSPSKITPEMASSHEKRSSYLEKTIKMADKNIKEEAQQNPEHKGMGSTIIMAWLWKNELTISWCGDSRAYIFNQKTGIQLISEDHSYVQELVNKGLLTYEQTFDHPQNNIVTRSLGDPHKEARPESRCYYVAKGDIILLCSDGLSGVLRDKKTYDSNGNLLCEDNLEDILRVNDTSMKECREALWRAAERADWYDNVTAILCKITDGEERTEAPYLGTKTNFLHRRIRLVYFLLTIPLVVLLTLTGSFVATHGALFPHDDAAEKTRYADSLQTDSCILPALPITETPKADANTKVNADTKAKANTKADSVTKPIKPKDPPAEKKANANKPKKPLTKVNQAKQKVMQQPHNSKTSSNLKK